MKTYFNKIKSFVVVAAFLMSAMQSFSQARETVPTPAPMPISGPMDYGKDASNQKLHKHIISFGFFSLLNQHISFGYDQLLGNDMVLTTQLGIIGPSANAGNYTANGSPAGAFIEGGVKLFFAPDFVTVGTTRYNSMQGYYFKPQISISSFNLTQTTNTPYYNYPPYTTTPSTTITNYTGIALMLSLGKQWILAHSVSLDVYAGIGYTIGGSSGNNDAPSNYYSFESTGAGSGGAGIAVSAGLNLGVPF